MLLYIKTSFIQEVCAVVMTSYGFNPHVYADTTTKQAPDSHTVADSDEDDDAAHRIWTMRDLRVLHELQKPLAVVVSGVYEDPHRFLGNKSNSRKV